MTTEEIIKALEAYAKWDTISSEFSHEAHICWKGAQEIRRLLAAQWALDAVNASLKEELAYARGEKSSIRSSTRDIIPLLTDD